MLKNLRRISWIGLQNQNIRISAYQNRFATHHSLHIGNYFGTCFAEKWHFYIFPEKGMLRIQSIKRWSSVRMCRWRSFRWCGERWHLIEQRAEHISSSDSYACGTIYEMSFLPNESYEEKVISKCFNGDKLQIRVHAINFGWGVW